jgi:hypothetical protein
MVALMHFTTMIDNPGGLRCLNMTGFTKIKSFERLQIMVLGRNRVGNLLTEVWSWRGKG